MKPIETSRSQEPIKTYVRLKPHLMDQVSRLNISHNAVMIDRRDYEPFEYNQVFSDRCNNQVIFDTVMKPIVSHILQGYNACILAYGQTSSGKTYTMKGEEDNFGLIPQTIREIFKKIRENQMVAKVSINYFEIYNENIFDLLSNENPPKILQVINDKKTTLIQDLNTFDVKDQEESLTFYDKGQTRRTFGNNNINTKSSRSHTIFRINLEVVYQDFITSTSTISLVDLAGSQSISKTNAFGLQKKESENINKSLLALSNVIRNLGQRNNYINFRDSKLTRILQHCLTGNSKSVVICTVNQTQDCLSQTINTLKFGIAANSIKNTVAKNLSHTPIKGRHNQDQARYEQLCGILQEERAEKVELNNQIVRLKVQYAQEKTFQDKLLNQINDLKHKLLLEENKNKHNSILLGQYSVPTQRQNDHQQLIKKLQENIKVYKGQISRLENSLIEAKESNLNYKKMNDQLEKNEKNLLDKLGRYERELSILQKSFNNPDFENSKTHSSHSKRSFQSNSIHPENKKKELFKIPQDKPKVRDNPYTIGKVMQLSTRILDMKLQINEYMKANVQLQEENQSLTSNITLIQNNLPVIQEDTQTNMSKMSRFSTTKTKMSELDIRNMKEENRRLKNDKIQLTKKLNQVRMSLKKNSNNYIEELKGFNRFIDKNFTDKEKQYFEFLFNEDPKDFEPIPIYTSAQNDDRND